MITPNIVFMRALLFAGVYLDARADYIIGNLRKVASRRALVFSSAHFLRVLAARWLGLPADGGRLFVLDTASVSVLGYDHDLTEPVIRRWNQR